MRLSRLRKYKNKSKVYINYAKFPLMFYVSLFCLTSLISGTNGLYKADVTNSNTLKASWRETWDNSSLVFWKDDFLRKSEELSKEEKTAAYKEHYSFTCERGFKADIYNNGNTMKGPSTFFVRYSSIEDINKKKPGEIIFEDQIPVINSNELYTLKFEPDTEIKPGYYKFSALQRPLHPGGTQNESEKYEGRFEIWGEVSVYITQDEINACNSTTESAQPKSTSDSVKVNSEREETATKKADTQEQNQKSEPKESNIEKAKDSGKKQEEENQTQNSESNKSSMGDNPEEIKEEPPDLDDSEVSTENTEDTEKQEGDKP
ncbi:hypothetical protein [Bacillus sp. ISL-55]|uniref:hypothetical protein n=1 Tax=Bacillus sp. ISL-55 TaxID=2819134 RepID=UPI001BE93BA1|nr:hypothetical protein [Bacillus sp. ISL-55]MBT2692603.1 hypothetical protein [Bacillus sp. ISL-55]